jgi:hypothetical protein
MPVKIFRAEIGRKIEKDMLALKDEIDSFEKQVQEDGMEIRSIALSAVSYGESALYSMVQYGSKSSEKQSVNVVEK